MKKYSAQFYSENKKINESSQFNLNQTTKIKNLTTFSKDRECEIRKSRHLSREARPSVQKIPRDVVFSKKSYMPSKILFTFTFTSSNISFQKQKKRRKKKCRRLKDSIRFYITSLRIKVGCQSCKLSIYNFKSKKIISLKICVWYSTQKNPNDVVITLAIRTPLTKGFKGGFKDTSLDFMVFSLLKKVLERSKIDPQVVEDICLGNVLFCFIAHGNGKPC